MVGGGGGGGRMGNQMISASYSIKSSAQMKSVINYNNNKISNFKKSDFTSVI